MENCVNPLFNWNDNLPVQGRWSGVIFVYDLRDRDGVCSCDKNDDMVGIEEAEFDVDGNHYKVIGKSCCVRKEIGRLRSGKKRG